jgi:hypothetical protein
MEAPVALPLNPERRSRWWRMRLWFALKVTRLLRFLHLI